MSDEEAFIRAIVSAPGDDAPRLIYADWLDERGDPRGEYVRAEVDWARPWRDGKRPARDSRLLDLAIDFDAIWIARLSRPPLGICLDRLRIRNSGPPITLNDIRAFERQFAIDLPHAYSAMLLNHNGGTPNRNRRIGFLRRKFGSIRMLPPAGWVAVNTESTAAPLTTVTMDIDSGGAQAIEFADDRATGGYFIGVAPGTSGVIYYASERNADSPSAEFGVGIAPSLPDLFAYLN